MHARKLQDQVTLLEMKLKSLTFVDIQLLKPRFIAPTQPTTKHTQPTAALSKGHSYHTAIGGIVHRRLTRAHALQATRCMRASYRTRSHFWR